MPSAPLFLALKNDPAPKAVFKETFAEPTRAQYEAVDELRLNAARDTWRTQRVDQLKQHLLAGYLDFRSFTKRTGIGDGTLLRLGLCKPRLEKNSEHGLSMELTKEGAAFFTLLDQWELLLVKPGMELPLFEKCDPDKSAYWCAVP